MTAQPEAEAHLDADEPEPRTTASPHLHAETLYLFIEGKLPRRKLKSVEAHFDACDECTETLAMVLRTERPASREEQQLLAKTTAPSDGAVLDALKPHIDETPTKSEWKPIAAAFVVAGLVASLAWLAYDRYWLPAASRRAAQTTLNALVELRQATGRIPLRYITEFERAGVVRSGFDTTDAAEQALLYNLRAAVDRAPEPEAVLMLGLLLLDAGELADAEAFLNQALETHPDSVDALNGLAVVYYEKARLEAANAYAYHQRGLGFLRKAAQFGPDDLRVLYNFGKFYDALGMHGAAQRAWGRYLMKDQVSQWAEQAAGEITR